MERRELAADTSFSIVRDEVASWWKSPTTTIIQVEALVTAGAVLLFILSFFGSSRRWSANPAMKGVVWLAYSLSFSLVSYTLGMMHSLPIKHEQYPVWAVSLLLILGATSSVTVYDLDDNKKYWSHFTQQLLCLGYVILIFTGDSVGEFKFKLDIGLLVLYAFISNGFRIFSCILASTGGADSTKLIADYIENEVISQSELDDCDPASLKGYKYPVVIEDKDMKPEAPSYRSRPKENAGILTVQDIWGFEGTLMQTEAGKQMRDVCLSFALYQQLKGSFNGINCIKRNDPKSRDFVLQGLLSGDDGYKRAFRVIEVELAFLYDFFFTRYAFAHINKFDILSYDLMKLFYVGSIMGIEISGHSMNKNQAGENSAMESTRGDIAVTIVILTMLFFVELSQVILYLLSDWARVTRFCMYIKDRSQINENRVKCFEFLNIIRRFKLGTCRIHWYWRNQLGQYSLVHMASRGSLLKRLANKVPIPAKCINLHLDVKKAIACSLKASNGQLTNGKSSLQRYGVLGNFSWACQMETQIHTIMVWHIATSYCEMASNAKQIGKEGKIAIELSRYCMHLVTNVPELLPENQMYTKVIFAMVKEEATKVLKEATTIQDVYQKMTDLQVPEDTHKVFEMGVILGRQLESMEDRVWKMMAEFWAELVLYIAPSDNIRGHIEHLAQRGEFLSHLWALLWHAGIHKHA